MVNTSVVGDLGTVWALAAQFVLAGFMGALWFQHRAFWRADRGAAGPFWLMLWSAALAMLFFVNALLVTLPTGPGTEAIHFIRAQILQTTVLMALPVVKAFTRGRHVRWWVTVAGAMFVGRAVLWLTTDLIWVHGPINGISQDGRHLGTTFLAPLIVVAWYVATSTTRLRASRARLVLQLASALTLAGLFSAYLIPPGPGAELMKGAWALPLVAALHLIGQQRLRSADQRADRQRQMRDALTEIRDAAWLATDPAEILQLAERTAREQVGDEALVGSIGPGSRGQFSATFHSTTESPMDDAAKGFLEDLSAVVSVAAERLRLADNLREEALTDYLTRLPNRKALELHLRLALVRAEELGTRLALLYCDVDEFKRENDQHGHAWGDELLQRIAGHLGTSLRKGTFVARVGGDEFVVVIEDAGSRDDLVGLATRIRSGLTLQGSLRLPPLLSVGVAVWDPREGIEADLLLHEADAAMFEGKRSAGGVVMFDETLRAQMAAEQGLGREIDAALRDEGFTLHYQAIVDSRTLEIVGMEALIRWPDGEGMRMPAEWIPFAEKTGQIVPIGRWVVVAARAAATRFRLPVAVNVAARQLAEPQFVEHLTEDWGHDDWGLLTLEITESDLLDDLSHAIESLTAVRALGARISIDDFGTGHSSFARLARLPVDELKIDQAFVRDLDTPGGVAIVQAIVALADAYGLDIVAEGVERIEQLELLIDLGVPHLQGYLLGRPSPALPARVDLRVASQTEKDVVTSTQSSKQRDARHRDLAGAARDLASEQRDRAAEQRDRVAELDEALTNMESIEVALRRAAVARLEAASDRQLAALDRRAAASERDLADVDLAGA